MSRRVCEKPEPAWREALPRGQGPACHKGPALPPALGPEAGPPQREEVPLGTPATQREPASRPPSRHERGTRSVVLSALATANPRRYATQAEIYAFLAAHFPMQPAELDLYRRLLTEGPIRGRYIAVDVDEEICSQDADELIGRFARHARRIAAEAARAALGQVGLSPAQIEGLVVNTCTGYLCPGLSSYVVEDLGLPAFTSVLDLMGMGCGGAIPNLEAACRMIQSGAKQIVLCLSVEICSATFFLGPDPDLIVSNSIFADGASAAVLTANPNGDTAGAALQPLVRTGPTGRFEGIRDQGSAAGNPAPDARSRTPGAHIARFLDFESVTLPRYREQLRYTTQGGRLRNVLTRNVPVIGARAVAQVVERLLARHGLSRQTIACWAVHPGGTQVLQAVQRHLGLPPEKLRFSHEIFRNYGNMSSPSVMFVLDKILREAPPAPGSRGLLLSFGAGFTAFAALVEFL
jgi:predicted naringenin-chalcone synthase